MTNVIILSIVCLSETKWLCFTSIPRAPFLVNDNYLIPEKDGKRREIQRDYETWQNGSDKGLARTWENTGKDGKDGGGLRFDRQALFWLLHDQCGQVVRVLDSW